MRAENVIYLYAQKGVLQAANIYCANSLHTVMLYGNEETANIIILPRYIQYMKEAQKHWGGDNPRCFH